MLKRLSMVLAATAVMGICMAMMPQRVEAGALNCSGSHKHKNEAGKQSCWGDLGGYSLRSFTTSRTGRYSVTSKWLRHPDIYDVRVMGSCYAQGWAYNIQVQSPRTVYVNINY